MVQGKLVTKSNMSEPKVVFTNQLNVFFQSISYLHIYLLIYVYLLMTTG